MNIFPLPPIAPLLFTSHHFRELRQEGSSNVIKNKNNNNNKHIHFVFLAFQKQCLKPAWLVASMKAIYRILEKYDI